MVCTIKGITPISNDRAHTVGENYSEIGHSNSVVTTSSDRNFATDFSLTSVRQYRRADADRSLVGQQHLHRLVGTRLEQFVRLARVLEGKFVRVQG